MVIFHAYAAQWGVLFEFWHAWSHRRRNHARQTFCQSVQGFWGSDPLKFCYLHMTGWSIT